MANSPNEQPFEYFGQWLKFTASRCDFADGVEVTNIPGRVTENDSQTIGSGKLTRRYMQDVAAMIGYHATNIHPQLNGFPGYDCCHFKFVDEN